MTLHNLPPTSDDVNVTDIPWASERLPALEAVDLLGLDELELLNYARALKAELAAMRVLVREALGTIARLTAQLKRAAATVQELRRAA